MKNLDIEKLERKNIYTKEHVSFTEMQANVLRTIAPEKKTKIISLKWFYAAAAAIALVLGFNLFINTNNPSQELENQLATVQDAIEARTDTAYAMPEIADQAHPELPAAPAITIAQNKPQQSALSANSTHSQRAEKTTPSAKTTELQMDQVLSNFPVAELADLGNHAEQDVYLELYN